MQSTISTGIFRINPATYLRVVAGNSLPTLLTSIILFALVAIGTGVIFDTRIILVALIVIFLIFPFYIYYIYFTRLLTKEAQNSVRAKNVIIMPGKEIIEQFHSADESITPPPPHTIAWNNINYAKANSRHLLIYFQSQQVPLIIPLEALPDDTRIEQILEIFPHEPVPD